MLNRFWGMAEGRVKAAPAQSAPYKDIALHWISKGRYCVAVREVGC